MRKLSAVVTTMKTKKVVFWIIRGIFFVGLAYGISRLELSPIWGVVAYIAIMASWGNFSTGPQCLKKAAAHCGQMYNMGESLVPTSQVPGA
jgi:hypothetical protein